MKAEVEKTESFPFFRSSYTFSYLHEKKLLTKNQISLCLEKETCLGMFFPFQKWEKKI